jgi:hypothetical protein
VTISRRLILDNLVTTLEAINGTGDYTTTVANVFRHTRTWNQVDRTLRPAICIHEGETTYEYFPSSVIRVEFTVDLLCYVDATGEDARINALNDLLDDLFIALFTDQTRGVDANGDPNAVSTTIVSSQTDGADSDGQECLRVTLLIVYERDQGVS